MGPKRKLCAYTSNWIPRSPSRQIECVSESTYLGSTISTELGTHRDIKNRLSKAKFAFARLLPALKSNSYIKNSMYQCINVM
ncbi:hypothetical protein BpHYR1_002819 [Brachionus plicatilis]|uniref:Uncharacterized protein n=1 Tax=Brachionus plicatilis TaxID=10195 RepID=A0A3M7R1I8_BRAPC|nr:hypothetical protein BpHYR1_002819 [Brachionus plicatilis]